MNYKFGNLSRRQICYFLKYLMIPVVCLVFVIMNYYTLRILSNKNWSKEHELISNTPASLEVGNLRKDWLSVKHRGTAWLRKNGFKNSTFTHIIEGFQSYQYDILISNKTVKFDEEKWSVMWSHNYPFTELRNFIKNLRKVHCINQYPGSGYITNKVYLATSKFQFIPKAFKIPYDIEKLNHYAKSNPEVMFVQKSSDHRGIKIKKLEHLDLKIEDSFIQEFIHNPLLIDGYKFDIGVYIIITSVQPLRVYMFEGDVLFRFCPEKYHPFSADQPDKYVVGDDYRPTWKVPSLKEFYENQQLGMKGSFDAWLRSTNKDPEIIWSAVKQYITEIFVDKEELLLKATNTYPEQLRFFELMRFDFIVTDQLQVLLMEANMSPNLSSGHFHKNRLIYGQVMINVLALAGLGNELCSHGVSKEKKELRVAAKDIVAFPEHCKRHCVDKKQCKQTSCQLCNVCMSTNVKVMLQEAFLEHMSRTMTRRLLPAPLDPKSAKQPIDTNDFSPENTLMAEWFRGKCLQDKSFCS